MAGYIGSKGGVVQLDGYTEAQADAEFVTKTGDTMSGNLSLGDNNKAIFGNSQDLQIYHDGSNSWVRNFGTGSLYLAGDSDGDVIIQGKAGENSVACFSDGATRIYNDGAEKIATTSTGISVTGNATFADNGKAIFGAGSDLQIYHSGTTSYISDVGVGDLLIQGSSAVRLGNTSGANYFKGTDGAQVQLYYGGATKLTTTATGISVTGNATFADNGKAIFGAGSDLQIYHNGASYITDSGQGSLFIEGTNLFLRDSDGNNFIGMDDLGTGGQVKLYHNAQEKLATRSTGIDVTGAITATGISQFSDVNIPDNNAIRFGNSQDLQIYHDGSNSYIDDAGTGNLQIRASSQIKLQKYTGENMFVGIADGAASMYYDNSQKIATTSTGIDVTGTATMDALDLGATTDASTVSTTASDYQLQLGAAQSTTGDIGRNISFDTGGTTTAAINTIDGGTGNTNALAFFTSITGNLRKRLLLEDNGDISFYEDTGTTAKFFWDASAERLGIGEASPATDLHITNSGATQLLLESGNTSQGILLFGDAEDLNVGSLTYDHSDNSMRFETNDTEAIRIDSSGNVGIGTDSPLTNLDVVTTAAGTKARIRSNTTNAPTAGLELCRGTSSAFGADNYTDYLIENVNGGNLAFKSGINGTTSERMRIDSAGHFLVGQTSANATSVGFSVRYQGTVVNTVDGQAALELRRIGAGAAGSIALFRYGSSIVGSIAVDTNSTAYNTSSDYRLKENVVDLTGASARVNQLNPSRFNFIADGTDTVVDGFLAHEVADVVPEAIAGTHNEVEVWKDDEELPDGVSAGDNKLDDDGNTIPVYQGIDQSKLVPLLTAALQEALAEITSLKTRVEALEA